MPGNTTELPPPVNHVFVDFENVHKIDLAIIGSKAVSFTLLLGSKQTKLEVPLVESLLEHAASVRLVHLNSAGKNALDFTLIYYVGRAVAADPSGYFHIVSKDTGFDPLIEHLRSKHIRVYRHNDCTTLTFSGPVKPTTQNAPAVPPKPKSKPSTWDGWEVPVLEHLRKPTTTRPKNVKRFASWLRTHLRDEITDAHALDFIKYLSQAGHLTIGENDSLTYHLRHN